MVVILWLTDPGHLTPSCLLMQNFTDNWRILHGDPELRQLAIAYRRAINLRFFETKSFCVRIDV